MGSVHSFIGGFIIMISFILIGMVWSFGGGLFMDMMQDEFEDTGVYEVGEDWHNTGYSNFLVNLFYLVPYMWYALGIGIFLATIVIRQRYDRYNEPVIVNYDFSKTRSR